MQYLQLVFSPRRYQCRQLMDILPWLTPLLQRLARPRRKRLS